MHSVHKYARDVVKLNEPAGPHVRAQCARHIEDHRARRDIVFCSELADRAIEFFADVLKHYTAQFAGKPFELDPSQQFIIGSLFGWVRKERRIPAHQCFRRFKRAYIEQGKGSGKTPIAAGVLLYGAFAEGEEAAQNFVAASSKEQAMLCFEDVVQMCRNSPLLDKRAVYVGGKTKIPEEIRIPATNSYIKCLARTAGKSGSGKRPYMVVADEVHEHPDHTVLQSLEEGFKFRNEPLLVMATNSGLEEESSVCFVEHQNAVKIACGDLVDDELFPYVCGLDDGDDPLNTDQDDSKLFEIFKKANPTLGTVIQFDYLKARAKAGRQLLGRRNRILRWHFCVWTGSVEAWITKEEWLAIEDEEIEFADLERKRTWIGIDLSKTRDLTAVAYVAFDGLNDDGDPTYIGYVESYTPSDTLEQRSVEDGASYEQWVSDGWLTATPGKKVRYQEVAHDVMERCYDIDAQMIAYDQWAWEQFEDSLVEVGLEIETANHPQGTTKRANSPLFMPKSIDMIENLIYEGRLRVHPNPLLRMAVSTVSIYETENGNRRFVKGRKNARIDAIVALAMAVGSATENLEGEPQSPFDDPDFDLIQEYMA